MTRFVFILPLFMIVSTASAQNSACTRDVSRFCRAHMNEGDTAVLQCLQQNRGRLSAACLKTLIENGR